MNSYAEGTSVSVEKSRGEIETTLRRFGAEGFAYATDNRRAVIRFTAEGRQIRYTLTLPDRTDFDYRKCGTGRAKNSRETGDQKWEQACRRKWRSLALSIKSKLIDVQDGIDSFEDSFMSHIVLPGGDTVSEFMRPQIETAYKTGKMPALLEFGR